MHWNVSARVQIVEDYMTLELRMNWIRDYDGIYTQHEADCETLMFIINRWNERKTESGKKINASRARFNPGASKKSAQLLASYMDDYREAKMCYEYNLRELDHLIRHNSTSQRIHFIYESAAREAVEGMCEACDKIDTTNAILKRPWLAQD